MTGLLTLAATNPLVGRLIIGLSGSNNGSLYVQYPFCIIDIRHFFKGGLLTILGTGGVYGM